MSQTVVITGCSKGIGLALADLYVKRGCSVIAVVRTASDALLALGVAEIVTGVDFELDDAPAKVITALGDRRIDILVNNAVSFRESCMLSLQASVQRGDNDGREPFGLGVFPCFR